MAADRSNAHEIQCALDIRSAFLAEHGEDADVHVLVERIHAHCGHSRFKSMRLAQGWRRPEDAVNAFHQWRDSQGLSRTGMDVRSWQAWEAGGRPGPAYLDQLSQYFRSNAVLLGFASDYRPQDTQGEVPLAGPGFPISLTPGEAIAVCAQESSNYGAQIDTPIGVYTVDELIAAVFDLALAYPSRPILPSLMQARDLQQQVWTLRERCHRPDQLRELHRLAGWVCAILANASFDLGGMAAAQTQARVADLYGELSGDDGLRAWVRGMQALVAYWDGRPQDAVALAEAAGAFKPATGTALVRAASVRARALAQLGRADDVDTALDIAASLREHTRPDEEFPGILTFPHAKDLFWAASAHVDLGLRERAARAEQAATEAIVLYEETPLEQRRIGELSLARLELGTARLLNNDADGLDEDVAIVLNSIHVRPIECVVRRLNHLAALLDQPSCRANPHLRRTRERILDNVCDSSTPTLPSGGISV